MVLKFKFLCHQEVVQKLLKDPRIQECRYRPELEDNPGDDPDKLIQDSVSKTGIQVLKIPFLQDCF